MGAFIIFDIGFETGKDRKEFEKLYEIEKEQILVDEFSNSDGFAAWLMSRNPSKEVVYYMGFMGYAEPKDILKICSKKKIKIKFLAWIPINDRNSTWEKIKGKW